ncbi:hypothetical protein SBRCBS47491_004473 [Sporothrix bragantina]|uniref:Carboxylic ester hydrolase n=1 Tax=Sporothrix bragantina TaxID=671064 RepID=A0ABP0BNK5_9PEZI
MAVSTQQQRSHRYLMASVLLRCLARTALGSLAGQVIQTTGGPVQGIPAFDKAPANATLAHLDNWQDVAVWKGIPYAASTDGANRWRPPQPRASWNTTLVVDRFGDGCPTTPGQSPGTSEDCLNLNIWSAATNSTSTKLPVIFWTHPAGGSGADALFDGGGMAARGVVFVNYNHRDGAYGFLALPELTDELKKDFAKNSNTSLPDSLASGNWAVLDQYAALRWVHANIAAFGGDPERITVVGQSAGSAAVYHMVNAPHSLVPAGVIHGAIAESGIRDPRDPLAASLAESYNNASYALQLGAAFLKANNATSVADLRSRPWADLKGTSSFPGSGGGFRPTLDGYALPDTYARLLAQPPSHAVPMITGNTRDESGAEYGRTMTVAQYEAALTNQYGNLTSRALAAWPAANDSEAGEAYNRQWQDMSKVSSWGFAQGWDNATLSKNPIYTYFWDHAPPGQNQGAHHMSEINYVFNNLYKTDLPWQAQDYAIAQRMSAYWANFARTGDPNGPGVGVNSTSLVDWRPTLVNKTVVMRVGDGWGEIPIARQEQIELIEEYFDEQVPF